MALLTVQNLSLGYDSQTLLKNLSFSVNAGDYLCIVGENGSGKTTLMKTLLHLQKPISGEILTGDGLKTNEIGYLPQQLSSRRISRHRCARLFFPAARDAAVYGRSTTKPKKLWH